MSYQAAAELCEWDIPNCPNEATLHVGWLLDGGGRRERHLCGTHAAELRERPCEMEERPIARCNASCQILVEAALRRTP